MTTTETKALLEWYKTRAGKDGLQLIAALEEALAYITSMATRTNGLEAAHCLKVIEKILREIYPTDEEAQKAGWNDQAQRQEFLDSAHELASSIRHLASVIKNR